MAGSPELPQSSRADVEPGEQHARKPETASERHATASVVLVVLLAMAALAAAAGFLTRKYHAEQLAMADRFFRTANRLAAGGRNRDAVYWYQNALSISRNNIAYKKALAMALAGAGNDGEAAAYFHEILRADPTDGVANLMLARIAARQNLFEQASTYYHRAIYGFWAEHPEQNRLAAGFELVAVLEKHGSRKQVVAQLLEMADQAVNSPETEIRIGSLLLANGSPTQAADVFREVIHQNPDSAAAQGGLGRALTASGQYRAAAAALRTAARLEPGDRDSRRRLQIVEEVLRLDPTLPRLGTAERYRRSRLLLQANLDSLGECVTSRDEPTLASVHGLDRARKLLAARRVRSRGDAADENIAAAEELWLARKSVCGTAGVGEALSRIMERPAH